MYKCITSLNGKEIFNDSVKETSKKDQTAKPCCCIKKSQSYFILYGTVKIHIVVH